MRKSMYRNKYTTSVLILNITDRDTCASVSLSGAGARFLFVLFRDARARFPSCSLTLWHENTLSFLKSHSVVQENGGRTAPDIVTSANLSAAASSRGMALSDRMVSSMASCSPTTASPLSKSSSLAIVNPITKEHNLVIGTVTLMHLEED